ncbi:ferredoxin-type protein NapF [Thalassotalea sp. 42_200_T64]|nr:ferredoxin-type protein NapF [Thalassotalea sp. 42_200_T64]
MTNSVNRSKRNFLRGRKVRQVATFRLPWITSESQFLKDCSQCGDCLSVCEENIIVKGNDGYPQIDFSKGECTFCGKCVDSCSEPLFKTDRTDKAWPSHFNIKDNCLAKSDVYCQSCRDVCDARAITFSYSNGAIAQPQINQQACNSCGACIQTCPTDSTELLLIQELN